MQVVIGTLSTRCAVTNPGGNSTAASIVEPVPQITRPDVAAVSTGVQVVGDGVIAVGDLDGGEGSTALMLMFFGVGSNGNTFAANVYGWERLIPNLRGSAGLLSDLWIPHPLATFTAITLNSSIPGVLNTGVPVTVSGSNQYFASAMTLGAYSNSGISAEVISPGSGTAEIAHAIVDCKGAKYVEVRFAITSGTTSMNAVFKKL